MADVKEPVDCQWVLTSLSSPKTAVIVQKKKKYSSDEMAPSWPEWRIHEAKAVLMLWVPVSPSELMSSVCVSSARYARCAAKCSANLTLGIE